jgi:uncharacterized protein YndB with AHSA1/START domain
MLFPILLGAAVAATGALVVSRRPAAFQIERSLSMAAPPAAVFAQVNDFHAWASWSPYEQLDPTLKKTSEGPRAGNGARYAWAGSGKVGEGRMTLAHSQPHSRIVIELELFKPFAATNQVTFSFEPSAGGTRVTWTMQGEHNFSGKLFALLMNMDKLVGADFERGLASLKALVEETTSGAQQTVDSAS